MLRSLARSVPAVAALTAAVLLSPPALGQDDGWLDEGTQEDDDATMIDESETLGQALLFGGVQVLWSGYGDLLLTYVPDNELAFDVWHFNPIMLVRLGEDLRVEAEFEYEHSGLEFKLEFAYVDFTPIDAFNLRMGVLLMPIGEFNDTLHPSFRWDQVKRPAMFTNVVPAVWSDVGAAAFGKLPVGGDGDLSYMVFVVNGLGSDTLDLASEKVIRDARGNYRENNTDKAVGGRLRLEARESQQLGNVILSVSGYTGAMLPDNEARFSVEDVALILGLGPVTVQGEAAMSFLDQGRGAGQRFETGAYLQVRADVGKVTPALRYDWVDGHLGEQHIGVASANWHFKTFWSLRGEVSVPLNEANPVPGFYAMSSFFF